MSRTGYFRRNQQRLADERRTKEKEEAMGMFETPPAPTGGFALKEHIGSLVLVDVLGTQQGLNTTNGPADVIRANVAVIEGPGSGESYDDTIIFGKVIYSQLRNSAGAKVLGRVSQGNQKPGQSAPWILAEASADDIAKAEAWVAQNAQPAVTSALPPF